MSTYNSCTYGYDNSITLSNYTSSNLYNTYTRREKAAIKIQSFWRQYLAQQTYNFHLMVLFIQKTRQLAALEIQRRWRGNRIRNSIEQNFTHIVFTYPSDGRSIKSAELYLKRPFKSLFSFQVMHYCPWRKCFVSIFPLEKGEFIFKFRIDGEWCLHPDTSIAVQQDNHGNQNNIHTIDKSLLNKHSLLLHDFLKLRTLLKKFQSVYTQRVDTTLPLSSDFSVHTTTHYEGANSFDELDKNSSSSEHDLLSQQHNSYLMFDNPISSSTSINSDDTEIIDNKSQNNTFLPTFTEKFEDKYSVKEKVNDSYNDLDESYEHKLKTHFKEMDPFFPPPKSPAIRPILFPRASSSPIPTHMNRYLTFSSNTNPNLLNTSTHTPHNSFPHTRRYARDDQHPLSPFSNLTYNYTNRALTPPSIFPKHTPKPTEWMINGHKSHTQDAHTFAMEDTYFLCSINRSASYSEHRCRVGCSVGTWDETYNNTNWLSS